jgi:hypothetical protein
MHICGLQQIYLLGKRKIITAEFFGFCSVYGFRIGGTNNGIQMTIFTAALIFPMVVRSLDLSLLFIQLYNLI